MKCVMKYVAAFVLFVCLTPCAAADNEAQVAKLLADRAREEYEIIAKARAANRGLLTKIQRQIQPYLERRASDGELVYNFDKPAAGATPTTREMHELVDWHEQAVRRHLFLSEAAVTSGVKLTDALNRLDDFLPDPEDNSFDHSLENDALLEQD